jgi:hypothetical protein
LEEASLDKRVALHPKRQSVQRYYGIPLFENARHGVSLR